MFFLGLVRDENKSQKDRIVQVRYRPYNILQNSKKIVKIPIQKSLEIRSIPQNGHESNISVQPFPGISQTSLQQRRTYTSGLKHIQLKTDIRLTSDNQINSTQQQSNKTNDT